MTEICRLNDVPSPCEWAFQKSTARNVALVADVVRVIETVVGSPVVLVGQSMGGHTAMLLAAARPDHVTKLVLLESGPGGGSSAEYEGIGDFFRSWPVPFNDREAACAYLGVGPLPRAWVADLEERADGLWPRFDPEVMVKTMNDVIIPRWTEWESVRAPTLVVYGEKGMFSRSPSHNVPPFHCANASQSCESWPNA